jgi:hypothetical protein
MAGTSVLQSRTQKGFQDSAVMRRVSSSSCPEAEQFILRSWIRNSPGNETRNESIKLGIYETDSSRFLFLAQLTFLGVQLQVSDTKLGYATPMWVFFGTFLSEFRIRVSFPPIRN